MTQAPSITLKHKNVLLLRHYRSQYGQIYCTKGESVSPRCMKSWWRRVCASVRPMRRCLLCFTSEVCPASQPPLISGALQDSIRLLLLSLSPSYSPACQNNQWDYPFDCLLLFSGLLGLPLCSDVSQRNTQEWRERLTFVTDLSAVHFTKGGNPSS